MPGDAYSPSRECRIRRFTGECATPPRISVLRGRFISDPTTGTAVPPLPSKRPSEWPRGVRRRKLECAFGRNDPGFADDVERCGIMERREPRGSHVIADHRRLPVLRDHRAIQVSAEILRHHARPATSGVKGITGEAIPRLGNDAMDSAGCPATGVSRSAKRRRPPKPASPYATTGAVRRRGSRAAR